MANEPRIYLNKLTIACKLKAINTVQVFWFFRKDFRKRIWNRNFVQGHIFFDTGIQLILHHNLLSCGIFLIDTGVRLIKVACVYYIIIAHRGILFDTGVRCTKRCICVLQHTPLHGNTFRLSMQGYLSWKVLVTAIFVCDVWQNGFTDWCLFLIEKL